MVARRLAVAGCVVSFGAVLFACSSGPAVERGGAARGMGVIRAMEGGPSPFDEAAAGMGLERVDWAVVDQDEAVLFWILPMSSRMLRLDEEAAWYFLPERPFPSGLDHDRKALRYLVDAGFLVFWLDVNGDGRSRLVVPEREVPRLAEAGFGLGVLPGYSAEEMAGGGV